MAVQSAKMLQYVVKVNKTLLLPLCVALLLSGCMKDTDETVLLPVLGGRIPFSVLSADEQDSLRLYMPIYEGITPPRMEGDWVVSPMTLKYASDGFVGEFYDMKWHVEGHNERTVASYKEWQNTSTASTKDAHIIGEGDNFTLYTVEQFENATRGWSCKQVTVVSGTLLNNRIKNYSYAVVLRDKRDDNDVVIDPDSYRVFVDGDGTAQPIINRKSR